MKTCNKCGTLKPVTDFAKRKDTRDGMSYKCKACDNAYQAQRYAKDPDKIKASVRRWSEANPERKRTTNKAWREANAEYIAAANANWYAANTDHARQSMAAWHKANAEARSQYSAEWRKKNPGRDLALSRAKKARKIQRTPTWADHDKITAIYEEAAAMRALGIDVHVDHIVPLRGKLVSGLHTHTNLQLLLATDNLTKRNKFAV